MCGGDAAFLSYYFDHSLVIKVYPVDRLSYALHGIRHQYIADIYTRFKLLQLNPLKGH